MPAWLVGRVDPQEASLSDGESHDISIGAAALTWPAMAAAMSQQHSAGTCLEKIINYKNNHKQQKRRHKHPECSLAGGTGGPTGSRSNRSCCAAWCRAASATIVPSCR